ncbi:MAG: hypothetical protein EOP88_24240 [Verrucomicrobiaceae bacterium]|nr:MAG: hypothetical protein EOP88_24240 [Verrucomicrobiaceae bacterium]
MNRIEYSTQQNKLTLDELRAEVRSSKAYWSSPAGRAVEQRRAAAPKRETRGIRFPGLAGTKPAVGYNRN